MLFEQCRNCDENTKIEKCRKCPLMTQLANKFNSCDKEEKQG